MFFNQPPPPTFSDFITQIAAQAGIPVRWESDSRVSVLCNLPRERRQTVYIDFLGEDAQKNILVGFYSPVIKLPPNQMLGQKMANDLLRENANLPHGAWAILKLNDGEYLVACDTQIAQHMQPQELSASVSTLAFTADEKEKILTGGGNVF